SLRNDIGRSRSGCIPWSGVILDEAHFIKNNSQRTSHCLKLLGVSNDVRAALILCFFNPSVKAVKTITFRSVATTSLIRSSTARCLALWSATRSLVRRARKSLSFGPDGSAWANHSANDCCALRAAALSTATGTQLPIFSGRSSTSSFFRRDHLFHEEV